MSMKPVKESMSDWLGRLDPDGSRYLFNGICQNWDRIVGPEAADLVKPLGKQKSTLILGAEDSIVIQEFSFLADQILEMVNSFCGSAFFDKVRVELLKGRTPLDKDLVKVPRIRVPEKKPGNLGKLKELMNHDSPVARCYENYVKYFSEARPHGTNHNHNCKNTK